MAPVETFLDKGHRVFNYNDNALYFVLGEAAGYNYPTIERLQAFTLQTFAQNQKLTTSPAGVYFSIWGDRARSLDTRTSFTTDYTVTSRISKKIKRLFEKFGYFSNSHFLLLRLLDFDF
ncbi:hypothetical protein [Enterococcus bulliens]